VRRLDQLPRHPAPAASAGVVAAFKAFTAYRCAIAIAPIAKPLVV
jgi:hypothetical protein